MEKEFKFEIGPDKAAVLPDMSRLRALQTQAPREVALASEYFDTPDLLLRRAGASLRVRREGKHCVQTLKGAAKARAGFFEREEYETGLAGTQPELAALRQAIAPDSSLADVLQSPSLPSQLKPVFSVRTTRLVWPLRLSTGDEIELALDRGEIKAGKHAQSFCELELELKQGQQQHLHQLALQLVDELGLSLGLRSKSDRGYALLGAESLSSASAIPIVLKRRDTLEQAFDKIAANCLAHIHANAPGVAAASVPEAVHQMRVGIRRLRSALQNFAPMLSLPAPLQDDLKWLVDALGQSRDLEVLAFSTFPRLQVPASKRQEIARAESIAAMQALASREQAAQALRSPRGARLLLGLDLWLTQAPWREDADPARRKLLQTPARAFAAKLLKKRRRQLLARGRGLQRLEGAALHRARIAVKKMRYSLEFFCSLFEPRIWNKTLRALNRLQDDLGSRNDLQVADRLLAQMHGKNHAALCFARGVLAAHMARAGQPDKRRWRRFKRAAGGLQRGLKAAL